MFIFLINMIRNLLFCVFNIHISGEYVYDDDELMFILFLNEKFALHEEYL